MSSAARIAATAASPTTRAAIAIAQSVRARRRRIGSRPARPICCRSAISTWSSRCRPRSPRSPTRTRRSSTICLFRTAAETLLTIAADPQAPRRAHRRHRRAPQLGLGDDPPPARPYDCAGRRDIASTGRAGCAASPASCCQCGCCPACSGGSSWRRSPTPTRRAGCAFFGEIEGLLSSQGLRRASRAAQAEELPSR